MKKYCIGAIALGIAVLVIGSVGRTFTIQGGSDPSARSASGALANATLPDPNADAPYQPQLANPPQIVKAIYLTSWSAASEKKMNEVSQLLRDTELNAVVIDIKDFTGMISYKTKNPIVNTYDTQEARIVKPNALLKRLHDEGIYVIARISVFQDQTIPKIRPDLALKDKTTGEIWKDRKGITWLDPASVEVWDYHIALAKDAVERGFDEVNFDYIRFPSDGNLEDIHYPFWDEKTPRADVMKNFFAYLYDHLAYAQTSVDIFGLVTVSKDDMGIGQYLENILPHFDTVAPMVYPSHYAAGFQGYQNPAAHPYEVVKYSIDGAFIRLKELRDAVTIARESTSTATTTRILQLLDTTAIHTVKLRPWIQDFDIGALYTPEMVRAQMQATQDALGTEFAGWMIWNPSNIYHTAALLPQ